MKQRPSLKVARNVVSSCVAHSHRPKPHPKGPSIIRPRPAHRSNEAVSALRSLLTHSKEARSVTLAMTVRLWHPGRNANAWLLYCALPQQKSPLTMVISLTMTSMTECRSFSDLLFAAAVSPRLLTPGHMSVGIPLFFLQGLGNDCFDLNQHSAGYQSVCVAPFNKCISRISTVRPWQSIICRSRRWAMQRLTVSRRIPR